MLNARIRDQQLLDACCVALKDLTSVKRWMTAGKLAGQIKESHNIQIDSEDLFQALQRHSQGEFRKIRHSMIPSRKTLDVLWGHIDNVGDRAVNPLQRHDSSPYEFTHIADGDAPGAFISHNHRDYETICELNNILAEKKVLAWTFEMDIQQDDYINQAVQNALNNCAYFFLFLSRNSLTSLWVRKELENASAQVYVLVDGMDEGLIELCSVWRPDLGRWNPAHANCEEKTKKILETIYPGACSNQIRKRDRATEFLGSLNEYMCGGPRFYLFPKDIETAIRDEEYSKFSSIDELSLNGIVPS